jgi:hypothetical protein
MINDLSVSENSTNKMLTFEDDSTISEVIPRTENSNLQEKVDQVANWSNNNKFQSVNSGKCKELRINFTKDPCRDEPVKINDKHLEVVTSAKILGMTITDDLKWNVYVANILLKASATIPGRVPQGTKLAPWLFLIMINDLSVSENSTNKMLKFADDSTISEVIPRTENSNLQDHNKKFN